MGDFEDVFGAGVDADEIISGYSKSYEKASAVEKANWSPFIGTSDPKKLLQAHDQDEYDNWSSKMDRQGFVHETSFKTFQELDAWQDKNKTIEFISRRTHLGFVVFVRSNSSR